MKSVGVISEEADCYSHLSCCLAYPPVYIRRYTAVTWYTILCAIYTPLQKTTARLSAGTQKYSERPHSCSDQ